MHYTRYLLDTTQSTIRVRKRNILNPIRSSLFVYVTMTRYMAQQTHTQRLILTPPMSNPGRMRNKPTINDD